MIAKLKNKIYSLLRGSEKYTGTDMVYLTKGGFWLTFGQILSSAVAFLLSLAYANLLPKETYGNFRFILSIFNLLAIPSLQGMGSAIIIAVAKGYEGVLKTGFKTRLKWATLGSLASALVAIYFWSKGNVQFFICFLVVAACLPLMKSTEVYQSFFVGKKFFGQKVRYSVLIQFLATFVVLAAIFWTKDLVILVSAFFVAYAFLQAFFLFMIIKKYSPNRQDDPGTISYGKHLSLIGVLAIIGQELDKVLLFHYLGPAQVAVYSFATLPVEQVRNPLQNIQDMALPKFSVRDGEEIKNSLPKKLLKVTALILAAIVLYIIVVPYFFKIFYPQYLSSVFYSQLYAFNLLVFPISMIMLAIQARMKTRELYIIGTANQIVQISLLLILTPILGILGVVLTRTLGLIPYFFIAWFYFKKN